MKTPNPSLTAYMNYVSEEGLNLNRFVENGGRLLGPEDAAGLDAELADLRVKINALRGEHPRLGRQLEFLANFLNSAPEHLPEKVRNETAFALIYAVKDMDLMPDDMPGVGYLDDAAVTEVVLSRHAGIYERYCAAHDIEWESLKPHAR